MSNNKYKLFRNFMVNELGISREDIKEWALDAVKETVEKVFRGFDLDELICKSIKEQTWRLFDRTDVNNAVAKTLLREFDIIVREKPKSEGGGRQ